MMRVREPGDPEEWEFVNEDGQANPPPPPQIGHIEGVAPLPQGDLQPGPTPTGTYGLPNQEGFHQIPYRDDVPRPIIYSVETSQGPPSHPGSSEGPFSSIFGTSSSGTAEKASSWEATVKRTMSLTLSMPGREETTTATVEGSLSWMRRRAG